MSEILPRLAINPGDIAANAKAINRSFPSKPP